MRSVLRGLGVIRGFIPGLRDRRGSRHLGEYCGFRNGGGQAVGQHAGLNMDILAEDNGGIPRVRG